MMLLIDIGNSRVKWAWAAGDALSEQHSLPHSGAVDRAWLEAVKRDRGRPDRVVISNVAGARMADALNDLLAREFHVQPEFARVTATAAGVSCAYRDLRQLGVDRWLGVLGAWRRARRAACVINSGTATTVDAIDDHGRHLGGLIIPGLGLMEDSLLKRTSDIARAVDPLSQARAELFSDNTADAVRNGAAFATAAVAERAVTELERRNGREPLLLVTGGNAARVAACLLGGHEIVPDLVLQGLAAWAR